MESKIPKKTPKNPDFSQDLYTCDFCDYTTSNKQYYDEHILTRNHEKSIKSSVKTPKKPHIQNIQQNFYCEFCDYTTIHKQNYDKHLLTRKHEKSIKSIKSSIKSINENEKTIKNPKQNFTCKMCNFITSNKKDYKKHLNTQKHQNNMANLYEDDNILTKTHTCYLCKRSFNSNTSLWRHTKTCSKDEINIKDKDALVMYVLKQNSELQNKIIDMTSNNINNSNNINTINNHSNNTTNNAFNLNFFLNETCKNAMNITDFVSNIKMELEDLEHTGRKGYIEGISNIILKNLNTLEQNMRPLHCSDVKREILYIKDNDEWTKETKDKPILTKTIKNIANENIKQISKWKDKYPDCINSNSRKNDFYLKIVSNSMNGLTKEESDKNINKIIKNIAKEAVIEKDDSD